MTVSLNPTRTALIVVDMQRYFLRPEYPLGRFVEKTSPESASQYYERVHQVVVPNVVRLLEASRKRGVTVVFTEFGDRDFDAFVVSDACATFDQSCHDAALQTIGAAFGTVMSTDDAVVALGAR